MKKRAIKKLSLNKKTIASLGSDNLGEIKGGVLYQYTRDSGCLRTKEKACYALSYYKTFCKIFCAH